MKILPSITPYMETVTLLFSNHSKLQTYMTEDYIKIYEGINEKDKLRKISKPWSRSEKFVLNLALHLYSGHGKLDLNDIDYLDSKNKRLVLQAINIRFKGN